MTATPIQEELLILENFYELLTTDCEVLGIEFESQEYNELVEETKLELEQLKANINHGTKNKNTNCG
jgi:hypothetical protein